MDARDLSGINSSDHSGMMITPNSYGGGSGLRGPSMIMANSSPMMPPGMRFPFSTMASSSPKLLDVSGSNYSGDGVIGMKPGGTFSMNEPAKKKRGRPRKYGPDESMSLALCSTTSTSEHNNNNSSLTDAMAKKRGRPRGSGKKQQLDALGSSGTSFTPHVITVKAGEDVASKIMAFSQQGPRTVCILSANGAICNVTLRQPSTSCGTVTYEGRFEIISLSGSFLLTENDGSRSRTSSLSVELAASDGHVLGGVVAGILMAATPVQVVVGSFLAERKKPKPEDPFPLEPSSAPPPQMSGFAQPLALSPQSQASSSDSDEDQRSPMNHHGSSSQQFLPPYATGWSNAGN